MASNWLRIPPAEIFKSNVQVNRPMSAFLSRKLIAECPRTRGGMELTKLGVTYLKDDRMDKKIVRAINVRIWRKLNHDVRQRHRAISVIWPPKELHTDLIPAIWDSAR